MTTFYPLVLQCPNCEGRLSLFELSSYFINSSTVYSDGKVINEPTIIVDDKILICNHCNKEFWKEDAYLEDTEGTIDDFPTPGEITDLYTGSQNNSSKHINHLVGLLNNGFANTNEREVYLRTKVWHLLNDKNRDQQLSSPKESSSNKLKMVINARQSSHGSKKGEENDLFEDNLNKLINIFNPETDYELVLLAEMHRELGNFDKSVLLLNQVTDPECLPARKAISNAIARNQTKVIKIT